MENSKLKLFFILFFVIFFLNNCQKIEQPTNPDNNFSFEKKNGKCLVPPNGLIHWWTGDEIAYDIKSGFNGTLMNGTTYSEGFVDQAFMFDGIDDYIEIPNMDYQQFTFDTWVKRARLSVPDAYDRLLLSVANNGWGVYFETDNTIKLTCVGMSNVGSIGKVEDYEWHHIAVTYDGTKACFYIDGKLDICQDYVVNFNTDGSKYSIGSRGADEYFMGLIDEVEIFSRALTQPEIFDIYSAGELGKCKEVTICHKPGTPAQKTLIIPIEALKAHVSHGDFIGSCE